MSKCENSSDHVKCPNDATIGHIFCNPCRVANGGYSKNPAPLVVLKDTKRKGSIQNLEIFQ